MRAILPGPTKQCSKCKKVKNSSDFGKDKNAVSGLTPRCKECTRKDSAKYYAKNKKASIASSYRWAKNNKDKIDKIKKNFATRHPEYNRKRCLRKYNLSLEDYDKMFEAQKGLCAICGKPEIFQPNLSIDHNHNTGEVRGLLCQKCNSAIGMLDVDNLGIMNLQMAINYLQRETNNE